jgi:hypothetical protein
MEMMMAETKKTITKEQKLQAFALFTMARTHYAKAREFERALGDFLGFPEESRGEFPYLDCISDELQESDASFDRGLKNEGFEVKKSKR